jgi:hypothetical protein
MGALKKAKDLTSSAMAKGMTMWNGTNKKRKILDNAISAVKTARGYKGAPLVNDDGTPTEAEKARSMRDQYVQEAVDKGYVSKNPYRESDPVFKMLQRKQKKKLP